MALCLLLPALQAHGGTASPEADKERLRTLVVLDVSGSMAAAGGGGKSLLDGAKRALAELAYSLPRDSQMGLRVYGAKYGGRDRSRSCQDTQLLLPIRAVKPHKVVDAAAPLKPTGDTPIGESLIRAAKDFGGRTTNRDVIVLISDGQDNCSDTPPCDVVKKLTRNGLEVRIATVGVALPARSEARSQLNCIANATGGNYYDAGDSDSLSAALERISAQARGVLGGGRPLPARGNINKGVSIKPGTYSTSLQPGKVAVYRFRTRPGDLPVVRATIQGTDEFDEAPANECDSWRAELRNLAGEGYEYPPYGNSGLFDGTGFGSTGASTRGPVGKRSTGIDYTGWWTLRLSLGRDAKGEEMECAKSLPRQGYDVNFSLDLDGAPGPGRAENARPKKSDAGGAGTGPSGSATPDPEPSSEKPSSAADKYNTPAEPEDSGGSATVVTAVGIAIAAMAAVAVVYVLRQRRRRGW